MDRQKALIILDAWVSKEFTRTHLLATEAVMRAYAKKLSENVELWGLTGLLHDADWDAHPNEHPAQTVASLRESGDDTMAQAIASHGNNSEQFGERFVPRSSQLDHALFACDEITGFVMAVAMVRPTRLAGIKLKSIKKKLKDKSFAAAVNREEVYAGPAELGVDFDEHLALVIEAMQGADLSL
jgi:predicted hydrolase (HD superfamily)